MLHGALPLLLCSVKGMPSNDVGCIVPRLLSFTHHFSSHGYPVSFASSATFRWHCRMCSVALSSAVASDCVGQRTSRAYEMGLCSNGSQLLL